MLQDVCSYFTLEIISLQFLNSKSNPPLHTQSHVISAPPSNTTINARDAIQNQHRPCKSTDRHTGLYPSFPRRRETTARCRVPVILALRQYPQGGVTTNQTKPPPVTWAADHGRPCDSLYLRHIEHPTNAPNEPRRCRSINTQCKLPH